MAWQQRRERKALISTMFEEIPVSRDKIVQVKLRPRYLELARWECKTASRRNT